MIANSAASPPASGVATALAAREATVHGTHRCRCCCKADPEDPLVAAALAARSIRSNFPGMKFAILFAGDASIIELEPVELKGVPTLHVFGRFDKATKGPGLDIRPDFASHRFRKAT